jgi:hypothetical protein
MRDQPWHDLPPEIARIVRPRLSQLADEVIDAVRSAVPAYGRPVEGSFGAGLRAGVEEAIRHFVAEIEASGPVERGDVYRALGRGEMRAGRSLDALLTAYRVGARVVWRRMAAIGTEHGLSPETLYLLAESIFAYMDVLSGESAEGHALEQSAVAGEAQLNRRRLVRMLVREPPADPGAITALADQAGWPLPRALAVVAIGGEQRDSATAHLPPDVIVETIGDLGCAIVPDPDGPGRRLRLERVVLDAGACAGLGTTVPWTDAPVSFARAVAALALGDGSAGIVAARERAGDLLLRSDPRLASEFAADRLAPLGSLSAGARDRLTETLDAWLSEQGRLAQVAARLRIHPQTARYRLGRLRELFGDALEDPDERFWIEVALRAQAAS